MSNYASEYRPLESEGRDLYRYLYDHVHRSTIHNNQEVGASQMSTDGWMAKENVAHRDNGILFSHKIGSFDTCYNMDKSWRHFAKWNKSVTKGQQLYGSTYMRFLE